MADHQVAGVAVWAHTGPGPSRPRDQRRRVLAAWRAALPMSPLGAGAPSLEMAAEAKAGGANALLAFPRADDPVAYHEALGRELPVIAFYLYEAAGGVARSEEHTSELQSRLHLVCRLLLEKKKTDESKSYLDKAAITTACFRIQ